MSTKQVSSVHSKITDEIVQAIEAGVGEFEMPWHGCAHAGLPRNSATGNIYKGINTLVLWVAKKRNGFASSNWASYRQWQSLDAQVRKGEKGSLVVFYKQLNGESDEPAGEEEAEKIRIVVKHS